MSEKRKPLSMDQLENVVGGVNRVVNTGVEDLNAAVRLGPTKESRQIASLPNGTIVNTITDELVYDEVAGRHFVHVNFTNKDGEVSEGWIASSILGMKR